MDVLKISKVKLTYYDGQNRQSVDLMSDYTVARVLSGSNYKSVEEAQRRYHLLIKVIYLQPFLQHWPSCKLQPRPQMLKDFNESHLRNRTSVSIMFASAARLRSSDEQEAVPIRSSVIPLRRKLFKSAPTIWGCSRKKDLGSLWGWMEGVSVADGKIPFTIRPKKFAKARQLQAQGLIQFIWTFFNLYRRNQTSNQPNDRSSQLWEQKMLVLIWKWSQMMIFNGWPTLLKMLYKTGFEQ